MDVVRETLHVAGRTVVASVAAAGGVGGAAVNGVVGGVQGVVGGVQSGLSKGSRSLPAAALTVAAVGLAGLVEWPVLLPIGATVLGVHYLTHRSGGKRKRVSTRREPHARQLKADLPSGHRRHTRQQGRPARSAQH